MIAKRRTHRHDPSEPPEFSKYVRKLAIEAMDALSASARALPTTGASADRPISPSRRIIEAWRELSSREKRRLLDRIIAEGTKLRTAETTSDEPAESHSAGLNAEIESKTADKDGKKKKKKKRKNKEKKALKRLEKAARKLKKLQAKEKKKESPGGEAPESRDGLRSTPPEPDHDAPDHAEGATDNPAS